MPGNRRCRDDYVVFPVSILSYWWKEDCFDFRAVLVGIITHAKNSNQIKEKHKQSWRFLSTTANKWRKDNNIDVNTRIEKYDMTQPLTGIAIETLNSYISAILNGTISIKEDLGILAFLAIKSIIGKSVYKHISWGAIVSRMLGNRAGIFSELPDEIKSNAVWASWCLGKRGRESLINQLEKWNVAYIPNGKGFRTPAFSYKLNINNLIKVLEKEGKEVISMKKVRHQRDFPF